MIPIFTKQEEPFIIGEEAEPEVEPYIYEHEIMPENSMGPSEFITKEVNWSYFKSFFNSHTNWVLEYKRYEWSDWTEGNEYLDIDKTWNNDGYWKINLTFFAPVDVYSARFTFACDLIVLDYVEIDETEVWMNYSANSTEIYSVYFNWSDLLSVPGLIFNKGRTDDMFWFRFRKDNIPAGTYVFDPNFGYEGECTAVVGGTNEMVGSYYDNGWSPAADGQAQNITVKLYNWNAGEEIKCGLYVYNSGDSDWDLVAFTEERTTGGGSGWYAFEFDTPPAVYAANDYAIVRYVDDDVEIYFNFGGDGGQHRIYEAATYPAEEDPVTWDGDSSNYRVSIFCTYSEGLPNSAPTAEINSPTNQTNNEDLTPVCSVWANDTDADTLTVTFLSNVSGSWVVQQVNNSVTADTLVYWQYTLAHTAETTYWWRAYVDDATENVSSELVYFTTDRNDTWEEMEEINGSIYNSSNWVQLEEWNGSIYNTSNWIEIEEWNGSVLNSTISWINKDIINGSIFNTSGWISIENVNGSVYNLSGWQNIDIWNGSLYNEISWNIEDTWNGSLVNTSVPQIHDLDDSTWWYTIQEAIDNATEGNHIYCNASTYYENVRINFPISLNGAGAGNTSINGSQAESTINISCNGVNISNFTITEGHPAGICINDADSSTIENCTVTNNSEYGIGSLHGNWSTSFVDGVIRNCNVSFNGNPQGEGYNIYVYYGVNMLMSNVTTSNPRTLDQSATSKHGYGFFLYTCNYVNITNCSGHVDYTNPADPRPNETLNYIYDTDFGMVSNCNYSGGWQYGLIFQYGGSNGMHVENCTFEHDEHGIFLDQNVNAYIINNTFINCTGSDVSFPGAIWSQDGSGHYIYYNKFINCSVNSSTTVNTWYNPVTRMGNWHSEYDNASEGAYDVNGDGRADDPLGITDENGVIQEYDMYPLMSPYDGTELGAFWERKETWNGSIYNETAWYSKETWNCSVYNTSVWTQIENWNCSVYNETAWTGIETWNGSISNSTVNTSVDQITPYEISNLTWIINATDYGVLGSNNVTLWYRYSSDNDSWEGYSSSINLTGMDNITECVRIDYKAGTPDKWRRWFSKWNITELPENCNITEALLYFYGYGEYGTWDNDATYYYINNQTWLENNSIALLLSMTFTNQTTKTAGIGNGWNTVNVTYLIQTDINNSNSNFSIVMLDPDDGTVISNADSHTVDAPMMLGNDDGRLLIKDRYDDFEDKPYLIINYTSDTPTPWQPWQNSSNPDITDENWQWNFDFPNGTGYYQFYSIGTNASYNETAPDTADTYCYYNYVPTAWTSMEIWNGSVTNSSNWIEIEEWNGSLYNLSSWTSTESWDGSIYNISGWSSIEVWNGSVSNSTNWIIDETWSGSVYNASSWGVINTFNGSVYNISGWNVIETWNGSLYNYSGWSFVDTINGSIYNITNWIQIEELNGSVYNITNWIVVETINGSIYNISNWIFIDSFNGSVKNSSANAEIVCNLTGTIINCSYAAEYETTEYRWEIYRNETEDGDSGWCDCPSMEWTVESDSFVEIKLSINDSEGNITSASQTFEIDATGNVTDKEDPENYKNYNDCIANGYYWWNNSCHNCTRPLPWNEPEENPPAVEEEPDTSRPAVITGIIIFIFVILVMFYYFIYKNKRRKKKRTKK